MFRVFQLIRQKLLMEGRFFRYLTYAIGEIVLIVVGILIAVQIGKWNQERNDRREGLSILNRIDIEVKGALRNAENFEQRCQDKAKVLDRILQAMHGEPVSDRQLFLVDIKESTNYSWSQIMPDTASFQEIVSAGKLNLIKNQKLRTQISREYRRIEARWELIENRRTDYAPALNRLIINDDFLSEADITETTDAILKANLKPALIAEINRNDYMIEEYEVMGARLKLLLDQIQIELNELEGND